MAKVPARGPAASFAVLAGAVLLTAVTASPAAAFSFGHKKAPPPPPPPAPAPEPEIPVGPPVLAGYVIDTASAYAAYMQSASAIGSTFANGQAIADALRVGVHAERHQMQQGMVAYAAIVALQDPTFAATVRRFASHASTRDAMVRYILTNPNYVTEIAGHDSAAGLIIAALDRQGQRLETAGDAVRKTSYDIQLRSPWSKKAAPNQPQTLAEVKALSSSGLTAPPDVRAELQQASTGTAPMTLSAPPAEGPYSQAVVRGMAIAALAILGKAGDADIAYLMPLLVNDGDGFCFNMAKLNLYQCLSVARPYYENVYCLGLHGMGDMGRCVMSSMAPASAGEAPVAASVVAAASPAAAAAAGLNAANGSGPLSQ